MSDEWRTDIDAMLERLRNMTAQDVAVIQDFSKSVAGIFSILGPALKALRKMSKPWRCNYHWRTRRLYRTRKPRYKGGR